MALSLQYPNFMPIAFVPDHQLAKPDVGVLSESIPLGYVPTKLKNGESYEAVVYLNRYLSFPEPGTYRIKWHMEGMEVRTLDEANKPVRGSLRRISFDGQFIVSLGQVDEMTLAKELDKVSQRLQDKDPQKRLEAVQALSFLNSPLSIKYLAKALNVKGSEPDVIRAIARFDTAEATKLIESVIPSDDSYIVGAALDVLRQRRVCVSRDKLESLLQSRNGQVRLLTVSYLRSVGNATHVDLLRPLLKDQNGALTNEVKTCLEGLTSRSSGR